MKRIVCLGAAESGVGAAILAQKKGFDVFVSDMGKIKDSYKRMLDEHRIAWEEGQHTEALILNADEVVKSPGIPDNAPMIVKVREKGIDILSEIEFAGRYTDAKMICITGSNGKTTTTTLLYTILKNAGYNVGLAGNIGKSLALQVAEEQHDWYVIELSSFQLDNMYRFRAHIAILLNITPDHLDRYEFKMQNYVDSKMRILQNMQPEDTFIYWAEDPVVTVELPKYKVIARVAPFSVEHSDGVAASVTEGTYRIDGSFEMSKSELALPGVHNLYNQLAAGIAARAAGVDDDTLRKTLHTFEGVEHRLEYAGTVNGVRYINDSKATNVDACKYALETMPDAATILIIGGKDKGNDYSLIADQVRRKCKALVYLGADNAKLHAYFDSFGLKVYDTHSMKACVEACAECAVSGDSVLLSPCCASFDLFKNMEDRGDQFKALVAAMQAGNKQ
jgi:UDP-N-acetylmuramoylalanine--D-glutamate ligase